MNIEKLKENLEDIKKAISENANDQQDVQLVCVTKTVDTKTIKNLYDLGCRHFGENRTDVLASKMEALAIYPNIEWHFIGRLQTRQVKTVINEIAFLHSLDRLSLAKEIDKRATKRVKCFVQVNVSGEDTKTGINPQDVCPFIEQLAMYPNIQVVGLMTMAPYIDDENQLRDIFSTLSNLAKKVSQKNYLHAPCHYLSMGMTNDFRIAVAEGATFVRIGSALFEGA